MSRRASTLLAALSIGLLIYAAIVAVLMNRLSRMTCTLSSGPPPAPLVVNGCILLFGIYVPLPVIYIVGSAWPTCCIAGAVFRIVRRHNREKLGHCLDCGQPLPARSGRCSGCGLRYELTLHGAPRERERLFQVVLPAPNRSGRR